MTSATVGIYSNLLDYKSLNNHLAHVFKFINILNLYIYKKKAEKSLMNA
jgi:hypothetical protein